jgi:hypothetical protein
MWSPVMFLTTSLSDRNEEAYSCGFGGAPVQSAERRLRTATCAGALSTHPGCLGPLLRE